jgi:hypothetical protein
MRYIIVILLVVAAESLRAGDKVSAPDFSKYPQSESFVGLTGWHTNVAWHLHHRTNIFAMSTFPGGDRYALEYSVTESGQANDVRHVWDWAYQGSQLRQLSDTNLTSLRCALRALPTESVLPPMERLVIVSFRDGTNWVTRSYDSGSLPKPVRQIYDIVGERFESKPNRGIPQ